MIVQCNMNAPSFSAVILGGRRLRNGGENYTVFPLEVYSSFLKRRLGEVACHFTRRCIHPEREPIGRPPSALTRT